MGRCSAACQCSAWLCPSLSRRAERCSLQSPSHSSTYIFPLAKSLQLAGSQQLWCKADKPAQTLLPPTTSSRAASEVGRPLQRDWPTLHGWRGWRHPNCPSPGQRPSSKVGRWQEGHSCRVGCSGSRRGSSARLAACRACCWVSKSHQSLRILGCQASSWQIKGTYKRSNYTVFYKLFMPQLGMSRD